MTFSTPNNIVANTIDITYEGTTRPITFVWSDLVGFNMNETFMALTLFTFKDMIPNYQDYAELELPFNYKIDKTATLKLPVKHYTYTVETLGHGEIEGAYYNIHNYLYFPTWVILEKIVREIGIKRELIKLIDHDGNEIKDRIVAEHPNLTVFAVFDSLENKMEEKGIEKLDYVSKFRAGDTMLVFKSDKKDRLYDLTLIQFRYSRYIIEKRTEKFVKIRDTSNNTTFRKKILKGRTFEEYVYLKDRGSIIVMKESNIKFNTPYNVNI